MISPRMAATPPIRSSAAGRTSMQPPAAAAVRRFGSATQRGGNSLKKKNTKAAIFGAGHEGNQIVGRVYDVGVGKQQIVGVAPPGDRDALVHRPQLAGPAG